MSKASVSTRPRLPFSPLGAEGEGDRQTWDCFHLCVCVQCCGKLTEKDQWLLMLELSKQWMCAKQSSAKPTFLSQKLNAIEWQISLVKCFSVSLPRVTVPWITSHGWKKERDKPVCMDVQKGYDDVWKYFPYGRGDSRPQNWCFGGFSVQMCLVVNVGVSMRCQRPCIESLVIWLMGLLWWKKVCPLFLPSLPLLVMWTQVFTRRSWEAVPCSLWRWCVPVPEHLVPGAEGSLACRPHHWAVLFQPALRSHYRQRTPPSFITVLNSVNKAVCFLPERLRHCCSVSCFGWSF